MMKKIYIAPSTLTVQLSSRNVLISVSASESLGAGFGGDTESNTITTADVKGYGNDNLWDSEW